MVLSSNNFESLPSWYYLKKPLGFKAPLYVYNLISLRLYSFGESLILVVLIISSILSELSARCLYYFSSYIGFLYLKSRYYVP